MEWLFQKAEEFLRRHKFIRRWRKVLAVMMAMVVFMSTYAMVLPAITLESGEGAEIGLFADTSSDESVPDGSTVTDSIPEAGAEGAALTTETAVIEDTAPAETAPVENVPTENAPAENTPAEPEATETAPTEAAPTEAVPTEAAPTEAIPTEAAPTSTETPAPKVENLVTPEEPKYLENEKLTFENNSIKLTLTVPAAAKVVKGAAIDVREIGQPFANDGLDENGRKNEYLSYLAAAETALNLTAEEITYIEKNIVNTPAAELPWARFFAISIKNADGLITPACALPVEIIYKNTAETAADGLKVMCLLPNGTMTMIGSETKVATAAQTPIALLSAADSNFDITSKFVDAGTLTFGTFAVQVSEIDAAIEKEKEEAVKAAAEAAKAESATTSDASAAESVESIPTDESAAESADESQEESLPADESLEESLPADESTDESLDESLPADESADESLDESLPEEAEDESLAEEAEKAEDETEAEEESKADDKATKTLVTKGTDYTVTMTYTADAKIPAGAILSAKEILPTAYNYKGYFNKAADALNLSDEQKANTRARFFDIKIMLGTSEVTPAVPVQVEITYNKPQENSAFTEMNAVHFGKEGPEVISAEATQADAATGEVNAVGFEAGSFSVYGVMYTVDFETVDGVKWSWPGEGSYSIASILAEIGVTDPATDVKLVRTVDEGGAENVLFLEEKEDGWYLTSEAAFRDTFVLSIVAGEKVYIITVTDASEVSANDGIRSLLTDVNITGAKNENGTYVFYPDQPYGIELSFREVNKDNGQFPTSNSFTYQLPSGFMPSGASVSNYLDITLSGGDHAGDTVRLDYTINDSGLITFTWDKTTNPGAYNQLAESPYSQFKIKIDFTYNGSGGQLDFGNGITKDVEIRTNGKINTPGKNAKYNPVTNCVDYTVTVYSDGVTKNVVITDTVSGSALTYKNDAVATTTVNGKSIPQPSTLSGGNGFTMTVPQMNDGETITIKYSAAVDLSKVTKNPDGSWGTLDETGNKVIVKSTDNPNVEKENYGKDFENKISMSNIGKSGTNVEADENGHATVNWTIHANDNANVSMGGHYIKDTIDSGSNMTYNSTGIHVVAYNADGSQNYEKDIPWGDSGLTKNADGKSWTWNIPNQGPDSQKLSYVITYTTDADVSGRLVNTQVKNKSESDLGGTSDGSSNITPHGGALTAHKKVVKTDVTSKTVTWEINFDVPATGLNSAQIIDTMPTFWENGQVKYFDSYLGNSTITITPELAAGESYEATTSADGRTLTIDFYKTEDEQKVTGLSATGSARKIRVQFQTEFSEDWLTAAENHQNETNYTNHTNTGKVLLNGQTIDVSATTKVESNEPGMSKVHGARDNYYINGNHLPAFPYIVTLSGVSDDSFDDNGSLILEDTFNGKYLAFYPESQDSKGDNAFVGRVLASNEYQSNPVWNNDAKTDDSVVTSPAAGKVVINISRDTIPMKDGNYYPYYYVFYYLTVKDPIAVEKLEKEIQNSESGTYPLLNTVTNAKFGTASTTVDFSIDVLDKTITSQDGKAYYNNGNWMVDFKLDVNPDALDLGDDEELTLTDDYTNLAVDYTTIKIQKYNENGQLVDTTSADGVSWNRKGNRVTYTLQNGVHYVITYKSRITGTPENDGKVHFSNTAEYFGVKKWSKGDQNISSSGSGSTPTYRIQVLKHEKGAGSSPLSGAKFALYHIAEQGEEDSWQIQPSNEINVSTRKPVLDEWEHVSDLTTGNDGVAKTSGSLAKWTWYMLVETEAPVYQGSEHYQLKDFGYVFWITDKGEADYSHYVYLNDDVVAIDNEPPVPETVDIGVTKTWTNDNEDISKRKDITVRLYADGVPYDDWTDKNGEHLAARSDTVKVLPIKDDGTTDGYTWTDLPGGPVYSVVEDGVAGYTTTYYPKNTQVSGTINIKNKYIPGKTFIHVEKNWSGVAQDSQAEDITVQLKRKVSANASIQFVRYDGDYYRSESVPVGSIVKIEYKQRNSNNTPGYKLYNGLTTTGVPFKEASTSWGTGDGSVVIENVKVTADGITVQSLNDGFNWNSLEAPPKITVTGGGSGGTYTEDVNFNNENHYYTISAANGWKIDIDRLVKEDDDGKYVYYIEEVGVNDNTETPEEAGYTVTYENNDGIEGGTGNVAQDTIKVTNSPEPGSLEVTKTVSGTDAKGTYSIAVKDSNGHYYALDGTDKGTGAFYVSFSKDSTQKWNNLPAGTYTVEEQDASVDRYTWHVTGTGEVEVPVGGNAEAEVINIYEEKPVSGSIKLKKSVTVNGEVTSTDAADGDYTFTITGPNEATTTVATVTIKVSGGVATQYKLNDAATFTALPAGEYVVIPDLALGDYVITESPVDGMAVSSITGGKTGTADKANRKVTVTVTADEVVKPEATAAFVNDVKQFKFKKVWLDSNEGNANKQVWPDGKKLGITLYRNAQYKTTDDRDATVTEEIVGTYSIPVEGIGSDNITVTLDSTNRWYVVKFDKLDKYVPANKLTNPKDDVEWKYYVKETTVPGGYSLQYGDENGTASASKLLASEGETVINSLVKVALPDTGGPGTLLYSMLGVMLIAFAGTAYMILLRRRRASLKGGDNLR